MKRISIQRESVHFCSTLLLLSVLAFVISGVLPKGTVWDNHLDDGLRFYKGSVPETPAYPMWGYSLLAGALRENIIVLQGTLLLIVCLFWYGSLLAHAAGASPARGLAKIVRHPVALAVALAPFVFLSCSYFSNAMAALLVFWGAWVLCLGVENRGRKREYAASGLLVGLAFHFRSETLLLGLLLFVALLAFGFSRRRNLYYATRAALYLLLLFLALVPWFAYTSLTVQRPLLSSTNAGAVMYLGLGALPNNPWNIVENDSYASKIAVEKNLGSPWSVEGNDYFRSLYVRAIREHPLSFAKRALLGCRHMLTQGLYFPKLRDLLSSDRADETAIDYLNERLKMALGLSVNRIELERYESTGVVIHPRHYTVVLLEYGLRFVYLCVFLTVLGSCVLLCVKTRFAGFVTYVFTAHLAFVLLTAGFIQTLPRHTTLVLPIFVSTVIVLLRDPSGNRSSRPTKTSREANP